MLYEADSDMHPDSDDIVLQTKSNESAIVAYLVNEKRYSLLMVPKTLTISRTMTAKSWTAKS